MNRLPRISLLLALVLVAVPLTAQDTGSAAGHWRGVVKVSAAAPNAVDIEFDVDLEDSETGWTGDISIPAQGLSNYALADVMVDGDAVSFRMPDVPGDPVFQGSRFEDKITGEFTQGGQIFAFSMTRGADMAEQARDALEGIDPIIEKALEDFGVPGLSIAVVADDQLVFAKGYGQRDVENGLPATENTLFAIGSTSKAFTAFVLALLVDEGQLAWDDPVIEHMPDFRLQDDYATQHLTVKDLLIHSSGLPRHDLAWYGANATREEIFARLAHLEPTAEFRETWQYQNIMFMTAGLLAERVTGKTWEQLVQERIFNPLEMSRANFSVENSKADDDHALPYRLAEGEATLVPFRNIDAVGPAGSINSSVAEMTQWMRLHLGGGEINGQRLIEESTMQAMHTPAMVVGGYPGGRNVFGMGYGMGWMVEAQRGHFVVQHGGGIDGFISWVALLPKDNFGVVVYTNADGLNPVPTAVGRTVIDRILGLDDAGYLDQALAAVNPDDEDEGEEEDGEESEDEDAGRVPDTMPSHGLGAYTGEFGNAGYSDVSVTLQEDVLHVDYNGLGGALSHWHFDTFVVDDDDATLDGTKFQFRMDSLGAITEVLVAIEPTLSARVFTRLPEDRLADPVFLERFTGTYALDPQEIVVELRGTTLFGTVTGQPTFELVPVSGTSFSIKEAAGFTVEFLMEDDGTVPTARFHQPNGVFDAHRQAEDSEQ
ncbi:MAG: serine hydrolase [Acidobacteria bacterium]|nr:serine hydrolase [Acidobacteriota bacterium]